MKSFCSSFFSKLVYLHVYCINVTIILALFIYFHLLSTTVLFRLQLVLFSVLLLCTVGRTTAHSSAADNVTVLVNKWEDFIQNGVSIPLLTETDVTVTPEEEIKIKTPLCCVRAKLVQSSKITLTVKNGGQPFSVHIPEGETSVGWSFRYSSALIL